MIGVFDPPWVREHVKTFLPADWRMVEARADGVKYQRRDGLSVIISGGSEQDGRRWLHVSCATPTRLPSWAQVTQVKEMFIGAEKKAIQVLPPKSEYVNIHPYCLHLWHCVDGDPLPDFTHGLPTL